MCYIIEARLPQVKRADAGALSSSLKERKDLLQLRAQRTEAGEAAVFLVCEEGEGCACSLLADAADPDEQYMDLDPDKARRLAATLEHLANLDASLEIRSHWADGPWPERTPAPERVSLETLLRELRSSRFPTTLHAVVRRQA